MRIIGGDMRGKTISPPVNYKARPTTDFAKEGLFNVLANQYDFSEVSVLDLFSGTGSISFEFASRGCCTITSVEMNAVHAAFIKNTAAKFGLKGCRLYVTMSLTFWKYAISNMTLCLPTLHTTLPGLVAFRKRYSPAPFSKMEEFWSSNILQVSTMRQIRFSQRKKSTGMSTSPFSKKNKSKRYNNFANIKMIAIFAVPKGKKVW